jgi:hypothetical protein
VSDSLNPPAADRDALAQQLFPNTGRPAPVTGQVVRESRPEPEPLQTEREPTEEERVQARRAGEARALYPAVDNAYRGIDLAGVFDGSDPGAQRTAAGEFAEILADIGAEPADARVLTNAMRSHKRFSRAETQRGVLDLSAAQIAGARRLAARDPRLLAVLKATGADGNPDVIKTLARLATTVKGLTR